MVHEKLEPTAKVLEEHQTGHKRASSMLELTEQIKHTANS